MPAPTYAEVLRLAEQLTPDEQRALAAHLQENATSTLLNTDEWLVVLESMKRDNPLGPEYSMSREDWYDDDGR